MRAPVATVSGLVEGAFVPSVEVPKKNSRGVPLSLPLRILRPTGEGLPEGIADGDQGEGILKVCPGQAH